MRERSDDILDTEGKLGIAFVKPNSELLNNLYSQLIQISDKLGVKANIPHIPERGFIPAPLSKDQERIIGSIFEVEYAANAVILQDKLVNIPLTEKGEAMVSLSSLFEANRIPLSLSSLPFHEACGDWAGKERVFWVRKQVADRVLNAGNAFASIGITLHVEDAFRPVGVQEGLFLRRAKMILREHPDWIDEWEKVWKEARSKTAITPLMAGHKSGASLDITLRRSSNGTPLSIGNKYPEGGAKVAIRYPYVTQEEWSVRQLFAQTMEMAGLRIYPYETWHVSYGDLSGGIAAFSDSELTPAYEAIYGPVDGFDSSTGEVVPCLREKYNQPFFTQANLLELVRHDSK